MEWEITAYNGTKVKFNYGVNLIDAIQTFLFENDLSQWDIKSIINLH